MDKEITKLIEAIIKTQENIVEAQRLFLLRIEKLESVVNNLYPDQELEKIIAKHNFEKQWELNKN